MQNTGAMRVIPFPAPPAAFAGACPGVRPLSMQDIRANSEIALPCTGACVFACVLEGAGSARMDAEEQEYTAGDVLCARHARMLTLRPRAHTRCLLLLLSGASEFVAAAGPRVQARGAAQEFLRLWERAQGGGLTCPYEASAAAYALLMQLLAQTRPQQGGGLCRDAAALIEEEYHLLGGVEDVSCRLGVSKHHLIRAFTAQAGISPGQYLRQVRMENAKLLLTHRAYSVDAIACMVGYSGGNYFCKVFRQETGMSPGEYRAQGCAAADQDAAARLQRLERFINV